MSAAIIACTEIGAPLDSLVGECHELFNVACTSIDIFNILYYYISWLLHIKDAENEDLGSDKKFLQS